jgi:putative ABC transport system permease protein
LARETLLAQIRGTGEGDRPNLLFFDIQDDQIDPLTKTLADEHAPRLAQAPIVTMRIRRLKGRPIEELMKEGSPGHIPSWTLRREYRSTFRDRLVETEKVIAGKFDATVAEGVTPIPISMEESLAKDMQLTVGDEVEWDVQGVLMNTRITSLRSVEWQRFQPNFYVVFPAGVLEGAPKFFLVAVRTASPSDSARVQQAVVKAFSNVSAIDLGSVLQTLDTIFSKVEFVVRFIALFTAATGVIVLAGALMTGRFQRIRETVLLRTLGASGRQLLQIQLAEYFVLGVLAALTGGGLAFVGNALLAKFVFELKVVAPLGYLGFAVGIVTILTVATGFLTNRGITRHPPLEVLRQET